MPAVRRLASSRLARGLGAMLAGGAAGQGLVVLVSPVLTRLYAPSDFGVLAVFTSIVIVLSVFATLRMETAIVLPERDEDAAAVAWSAMAFAIVVSLVVVLAGLVAAPALLDALSAPTLAPLWGLIPLTVLLIALFQTLSAWLIRERRYGALGVRNLTQGLGTAGSQTVLGVCGLGPAGLMLGYAAGFAAGLGGLTSRRGLLRQRRPTVAAMRAVVSRYRRFPLIASWSALLNTAGLQIPLLVVSAVYGQAVVGLLGLTMRVLVAPLVLLGRSVAQIFVGEAGASTRENDGDLRRRVRSTSLLLLAVGALPTVVLATFGPWLFATVFGAQWVEAGRFAQLLSVGFLAQFVVSPVSQTLLVLERQALQLCWDVGRLAVTVGAPLTAALLGAGPTAAVALLSGALTVSYGALLCVCITAASRDRRAVPPTPDPLGEVKVAAQRPWRPEKNE